MNKLTSHETLPQKIIEIFLTAMLSQRGIKGKRQFCILSILFMNLDNGLQEGDGEPTVELCEIYMISPTGSREHTAMYTELPAVWSLLPVHWWKKPCHSHSLGSTLSLKNGLCKHGKEVNEGVGWNQLDFHMFAFFTFSSGFVCTHLISCSSTPRERGFLFIGTSCTCRTAGQSASFSFSCL